MKLFNTLFNSFKALGLVLMLLPSLVSGQTVLTRWNFNSNPTDASTSTGSLLPSTGSGTLTAIGGVSATFAPGSTSSDPGSDNTAYSLASFPASTSSNKTAGIEFSASTVGKSGISITFDQRSTNTSSNTVLLQYSINESTFTDATTFVTGSSSGSTFLNARTYDLSSITALNNNANVKFRLVSTFTGAAYAAVSGSYTISGTWRFDYLTVSYAADCTHTASASSNWTTAANWGVCGVPTNTTNVTIPTGVTVALDVDATINDLTFTGGGKLTLGANTLTINGNATGGSAAGWVVTDGAGALKAFNMAGEKTFPVGTAATYAPVKVDNSAASRDFSVKVGTTFSGTPAVVAKMVQLEWNVTPSNLVGNNAALTFEWPVGSEGVSFIRTNAVEIAHYNGMIWDSYKLATVAGAGPYTATASGFTAFSPFTVSNQNALSVDLLNISAQSKGTKNVITWSTASEKNNAYFEVQHATNGLDFQSIGDKIKGNGTTNVKNDYAFEHVTPSVIRDYYRLKQVDFDGIETLSKVVSIVATGKNGALKVYPTLASDKLTISLDSQKTVDFNVYNLVGQAVQSGQLTGYKELIINQLPRGAYLLKVGNATVKFSKN